MRVIIAGSRSITDTAFVLDLVDSLGWNITGVISGCAPGVDTCALMKPWACEVWKMPADWTLGRGAGFIRNYEMSRVADGLIAIWDGESHGTESMIRIMAAAGKPYQAFFVIKDGKDH